MFQKELQKKFKHFLIILFMPYESCFTQVYDLNNKRLFICNHYLQLQTQNKNIIASYTIIFVLHTSETYFCLIKQNTHYNDISILANLYLQIQKNDKVLQY